MGLTRGDVFPSRYLGKDDVQKPTRSTIADVRMETIKTDHGDEEKAVMLFTDESMKPMIVNATNWDCLEAAYGLDTDAWLGKPVEVYVDPGIMFGGRRVGGVRVRIPAGTTVAGTGSAPVRAASWTWEQALAAAAKVGMDKDALVAALKDRGLNGYNAARDTAVVMEIVAAGPAGDGPADDSIPF